MWSQADVGPEYWASKLSLSFKSPNDNTNNNGNENNNIICFYNNSIKWM